MSPVHPPPDHANQPRRLPPLCEDLLANGLKDPILKRITGNKRIGSAAAFNALFTGDPENDGRPSHLTILARYIYECRPDLQRVFPGSERSEAAFLAWLVYYGRHDYSLTDEFLDPLRKNLRSIEADLEFGERVRLDLYRLRLRMGSGLIRITRAFRSARQSPQAAESISHSAVEEETFGVNVHGYFRAEMGVGQSARNAIEALKAREIPYTLQNVGASHHSEADTSVTGFSPAALYNADLYFVNADQTAAVRPQTERLSRTRHQIGFWTWELSEFPPQWDSAFEAYDEIWVPSGFCQAAIAARSSIPVVRVPYCAHAHTAGPKTRADFGIDARAFVFLAVFDMHSSFQRKNPLGAIHAFKAAFPYENDCELIVKVNNGGAAPDKMDRLREEASGHSIRLIEETLRNDDVAALIQACDCVISLHRSEGFGLVLAEAMLMQRPVIATAYSGNMDFTTPDNAFLVSYELQGVGPGNAPYPAHCVWADPRIEDAAEQMKAVRENRLLREQRVRNALSVMATQFSPAAIGETIEARLRLIERRSRRRQLVKPSGRRL